MGQGLKRRFRSSTIALLSAGRKRDALTLNGKVSLESMVGFDVMEDLFKGGILQSCTIDISGDPTNCQ